EPFEGCRYYCTGLEASVRRNREAVLPVAEQVEHVRIDAELNVVHRAISEHGVHTAGMRRAEHELRVPGLAHRARCAIPLTAAIRATRLEILARIAREEVRVVDGGPEGVVVKAVEGGLVVTGIAIRVMLRGHELLADGDGVGGAIGDARH